MALHSRSRLPPKNLSLLPNPNPHLDSLRSLLPLAALVGQRKPHLVVWEAVAFPTPGAMPEAVELDHRAALECCFVASPDLEPPSCSSPLRGPDSGGGDGGDVGDHGGPATATGGGGGDGGGRRNSAGIVPSGGHKATVAQAADGGGGSLHGLDGVHEEREAIGGGA